MSSVAPITVNRYQTLNEDEAYSVKYRDLSILVTPPGMGERGWKVWYSDSINTLLTAADPVHGIFWAIGVLDRARDRTPASTEEELLESEAEMDQIVSALHANLDTVIGFVANQIAHLGSRPEWSMEDNFACTEGMATLAAQCGLPNAGNQSDEDLAFYERAEEAG